MNEHERIRKLHEQAVGNQFVDWIAERGGPVFSLIDHSERTPDLVYKSGERILNIEHTSAQYDIDHRKFIDTPVLGNRHPIEVWPPFDPQKEIKDVGRIDEDLAVAVVEAIEKKCRKARDHRYKVDPFLLVEVLPGMTTAEGLARLLAQRQFPSDCLFGRFPVAKVSTGSYSTGGPRVIAIKHTYLTENLLNEEHPVIEMNEEESEAAFLQGFDEETRSVSDIDLRKPRS
ncbi:MAG TPA: hypothetical protein VFG71_01910 [Nitrospiraceae bacterium]|nr:hypothetical protein [Nitrospiraceae bacterium]